MAVTKPKKINNKVYLDIVFSVIFTIALLAIIWLATKYYYLSKLWHCNEGFDAVAQLRKTQAQVDAMDETDLEECPGGTNAGFAQVCRRHRACCTDNAEGAAGCLCRDPVLASCRAEYDACRLANNNTRDGAAMSTSGAEFVGAKAARGDMCQAILANCCTTGARVYNASRARGAEVMTAVTGMKPVTREDGQDPVCSQITDSPESCRDSCAANPTCNIAYRDEIAGLCELYGSGVVKKKNSNEMMADNDFRMWTRGQVEILEPDIYEGFATSKGVGADLVSRCLKSDGDGDNMCQQPVISECQRLKKRCITKYSELLGDAEAKSMCAANHKACCQTLQNVDLGARFALDGPTWGQVVNAGGSDSSDGKGWKCDISREVRSLAECQQRCLEDPRCEVLDSNMAIFRGQQGMDLAKLPPAKCVMYGAAGISVKDSGEAKKKIGMVGSGLTAQVLYEPDNIWKRRVKDELDDEENM